jgi:hypothetical protein
MSRPKNPNLGRPFWCRSETTSPAAEHLLKELQTQGSRKAEALAFDGLGGIGRPKFKRVPTRIRRTPF